MPIKESLEFIIGCDWDEFWWCIGPGFEVGWFITPKFWDGFCWTELEFGTGAVLEAFNNLGDPVWLWASLFRTGVVLKPRCVAPSWVSVLPQAPAVPGAVLSRVRPEKGETVEGFESLVFGVLEYSRGREYCWILDATGANCCVLEDTGAYCCVLEDTGAYCCVLEDTGAYCSVFEDTGAYCCVLEDTGAYCCVLEGTGAYGLELGEQETMFPPTPRRIEGVYPDD